MHKDSKLAGSNIAKLRQGMGYDAIDALNLVPYQVKLRGSTSVTNPWSPGE